MIDIHCHILPYCDDGAESLEESLIMARNAVASGVDTIIMTPHCNLPDEEMSNLVSLDLVKRFGSFRDRVTAEGIPLRLLPGAEVFFTKEVPTLLRKGLLPTLNGTNYLLVEFYFDASPTDIRYGLDTIRAEGLIPILAHPERYYSVQAEPYLIGDWFHDGTVIQLNKGSVLGRLGKSSFRAADWILAHGYAHVLASDAHSSTVRTPDLNTAFDVIKEQFGSGYAEILLNTNPRSIIENRPVQQAE